MGREDADVFQHGTSSPLFKMMRNLAIALIAAVVAANDDYCDVDALPRTGNTSTPCSADGSTYCCDWHCSYCGSAEYCTKYSPFQTHSGVCSAGYTGCGKMFKKCSYCPLPDYSPCENDISGTDYCCDYDCTYCGSQEYCEKFSPYKSHSGVCAAGYQYCGVLMRDCTYCDRPGPCKNDHSTYCCDYNCTYCGSLDYCVNFSPFKTHSGICSAGYNGCGHMMDKCTKADSSLAVKENLSMKKSKESTSVKVHNDEMNDSNDHHLKHAGAKTRAGSDMKKTKPNKSAPKDQAAAIAIH